MSFEINLKSKKEKQNKEELCGLNQINSLYN